MNEMILDSVKMAGGIIVAYRLTVGFAAFIATTLEIAANYPGESVAKYAAAAWDKLRIRSIYWLMQHPTVVIHRIKCAIKRLEG